MAVVDDNRAGIARAPENKSATNDRHAQEKQVNQNQNAGDNLAEMFVRLDGQEPTPWLDVDAMRTALKRVQCSYGCRVMDPTPVIAVECKAHCNIMGDLADEGRVRVPGVYLPATQLQLLNREFEAQEAASKAAEACEYFSHSCDDEDVMLSCITIDDAVVDVVEAQDLQDGRHVVEIYGYTRQVPHERTFDAVYDDVIEALTSRFEEFVSPDDDADFPDEVHDCAKELRELMREKFRSWSCEVSKTFVVTIEVAEDGNVADVVKVRLEQKGGR